MMSFIKRIKTTACEYLFTVRCPYCNKVIERTQYACDSCRMLFPEPSIVHYAFGGYKCACPFPYDSIFKKAVLNFKFHGQSSFAKQLAFSLVGSINEIYGGEKFDIVTSVPMHQNAVKKRGYNQSELLAKQVAELMGIKYVPVLEKHKENEAQHSIKRSERAKNVKGVYRIVSKDIVKDKNILLIDDIITTGYTLGECARILTKAGCKKISCAALCSVTVK